MTFHPSQESQIRPPLLPHVPSQQQIVVGGSNLIQTSAGVIVFSENSVTSLHPTALNSMNLHATQLPGMTPVQYGSCNQQNLQVHYCIFIYVGYMT